MGIGGRRRLHPRRRGQPQARFGALTADLPDDAVFDRTNTLGVEISAGQLTGGTEQDSRDLLTLCYVDGEFQAYADAELKGVGRYTLGNLTRGAYGTPSTHTRRAAGCAHRRSIVQIRRSAQLD
ncbi:GTA baseplate fiber-binding domain-containing protein [Neisseria gonorrhoeae]|uniref:GTA baseplate fiber-binding domain-containing protein n=1 Tax=Neisseria gonorrhoeae TaxID=485 RepID=UPI00223F7CCA|nr:hypothetical protein [Neisseria gonorrhoeae]UYP52456.1 hypothetical protein ND436_002710 [Neisseria gonorrhoeae]